MFGTKGMTQLKLGPKDAAFVLREGGGVKLVLPQRDGNEEVPPDEVALVGFAAAFRDDRVRDLPGQILREKQY
ncbi:MAG: hypothetical protein WBX11_04805 [Thiobacillaceae bacterium]